MINFIYPSVLRKQVRTPIYSTAHKLSYPEIKMVMPELLLALLIIQTRFQASINLAAKMFLNKSA